jgi:hypothetical protein
LGLGAVAQNRSGWNIYIQNIHSHMSLLKSARLAVVIVSLLTIASFSGCLGSGSGGGGGGIVPTPQLHASVTAEPKFSLTQGCYYTATGYVYNTGNGPAQNAIIYLTLIDDSTGAIRDSKSIALGNIAAGGSQNFANVVLDANCGKTFSVKYSLSS